MKKISTLILAGMTILLASCNNFMNGSDLIQELDEKLAYLQAPYADITINSTSSKTEYISPAVGNHNKTYKKGDKFTLEFVPTEGYQFTKWNVIPEGSVSIRNVYDTKTEAIIENSDFSITIEPKVYERPFATIKPENTVENPRNSTIVITFSQSMNITEDDLSKIKVLIDDFDGLDYFDPPKLSDDNTKITYIPKRDNLIPVGTVAKIVKVVIPQSFSYLVDDCNVTFIDDYTYAYKINSTTETEVNLNIDCPLTEGEISYRGKRTLYLDDEITLKANPKDDYLLNDWSIVYKDNREVVGDDILEVTFSEDYSEIKLKVLTGSDKEIDISPVFAQRGYITVNFASEHGFTTPSEQKKYYVGDIFTISFRDMGSYTFSNWKAFDSEGRDVTLLRQIDTGEVDENDNPIYYIKPAVIEFNNKALNETECEVLSGGETITIEAVSGEIPTVLALFPSVLSEDVFNNTSIRVYFSKEMDESSIYWTEKELEAVIGKGGAAFRKVEAVGKTSPGGLQYYYAFYPTNNPSNRQYKNIEIKNRNTSTNYAQHYGEPRFEDNYTLVIPSNLPVENVDEIEVKISSDFISKEKKSLDKSYTTIFTTKGENRADVTAPEINLTSFVVNGIENAGDILSSCVTDYANNYNLNLLSKTNSSDRKLKVILQGTVSDSGTNNTGVKSLKVSLAPINTDYFNNTNTYYITKKYSGNSVHLNSANATFEFDMSGYEQGPYKIEISAIDNSDNTKVFDKVYGFVNYSGAKPEVNFWDVFPIEKMDTLSNILSGRDNQNLLKKIRSTLSERGLPEINASTQCYVISQKNIGTEIKYNTNPGYTCFIVDLMEGKPYNLNEDNLTVEELFNPDSGIGVISQKVYPLYLSLCVKDYFGKTSDPQTAWVVFYNDDLKKDNYR